MNHFARLAVLRTARVLLSFPRSLFWILAAWDARLQTAIENERSDKP